MKYLAFLFLIIPLVSFGQFTVPQGGTGTTTIPAGALMIGSTSLRTSNVPIGTSGLMLQSNGTLPTWVATSTLGFKEFWNGSLLGDIYNLNSGNVAIGTTTASAGLDVQRGGNGVSLLIGTDSNSNTARTNNTIKTGRMGIPHYTLTEEPFLFGLMTSNSTQNQLELGGGSSLGNASNLIQLYTASNNTTTTGIERMRITSEGKIGISQTAPDSILHVATTSSASTAGVLALQNSATAANTGARLNFNLSTTPTSYQAYVEAVRTNTGGSQASYMTFGVHNGSTLAERMRITETGAIGIGTSTPTARLSNMFNGTNTAQFGNTNGVLVGGQGLGEFQFYGNDNSAGRMNQNYALIRGIAYDSAGDGNAINTTAGEGGAFSIAPCVDNTGSTNFTCPELARFTPVGLQIGTTTSPAKLTIQGTAGTLSPFLIASSTGSSMYSIGHDGSLGVNTDDGTTGECLISQGSTAFPIWDTCGTVNSGTAGQVAYYAANGTTVSGTSTVFILNEKVGIGTSTPAALLQVHNNTATSTVYVTSGGATLGGRIIIEDTDGAGCTELSTLNGVGTFAIVACP